MSMFRPKHKWGKIIPTIPKTQRCDKCGIHRQIGYGDRDLLPYDMNAPLTYQPCQKAEYTQFQLDNAYRSAWRDGQDKGIDLRGDFTRQFFSKIRMNPNTRVYEIPVESYNVLKDMMLAHPNSEMEKK